MADDDGSVHRRAARGVAADRDAFLGELLDAFGLEAAPRLARSVERRLLDLEVRVREELGRAGERLVDEERSRP